MLTHRQQSLLNQMRDYNILKTPDLSAPPVPQVVNTPLRQTDFAQYLMTHVGGNADASAAAKSLASRQGAETEKQSIMGTIFSGLGAPLSAVLHTIDDSVGQGGDYGHLDLGGALSNIGKGLNTALASGDVPIVSSWYNALVPQHFKDENKIAPMTSSDLLHKWGVNNKVARYGGGFAMDVALDPLSYAGAAIKGLKAANELRTAGQRSAQAALDAKAAASKSLQFAFQTGSEENVAKAAKAGFGHPDMPLPADAGPKSAARAARNALANPVPSVAQDAVTNSILTNPVNDLKNIGIQSVTQSASTNAVPTAMDAIRELPMRLNRISKGQAARIAKNTEIRRGYGAMAGKSEAQIAAAVDTGAIDVANPARDIAAKLARAQGDFEKRLIAEGKVLDGRSGRSLTADNLKQMVDKMGNGDIPTNVINPTPAAGPIGDMAKMVADKFVDTTLGKKKFLRNLKQHQKNLGMLIHEVSPSQQVNMLKSIMREMPPAATGEDIISGLAAAEQHLLNLGVQPVAMNGARVRLSHVLAATADTVDPAIVMRDFVKANPMQQNQLVRAAIDGLATQRAFNMSEVLGRITELSTQATKNVSDNLVGSQKALAKQAIMKQSMESAANYGMTAKEMHAVQDVVKNVLNLDELPAETWLNDASKILTEHVINGTADPKILDRFNKKVAATVTMGNIALGLGPHVPREPRIVEEFMTRFTTWWGKNDLKDMVYEAFQWGEENARRRGITMRNVIKNYTPDQIKNAWLHASGQMGDEAITEDIAPVAGAFRDYMQRLTGVYMEGIGKVNKSMMGTDVATRSQMLMEDVNTELKRLRNNFQFTDKIHIRDSQDNLRNFQPDAEGWLASWSTARPENAATFMYDLDLAMERVTKRYAMQDQFVAQFGKLEKDATHSFGLVHQRVKGFYVQPEIGRQFNRVMADLEKQNWHNDSPLLKFYGKALRWWKTSVTIYLPSHHIRNLIGDSYLMWLAGHNNPVAFKWAKMVMHSQRGRYKDALKTGNFDVVDQMTHPEAASWANASNDTVILRGKKFNVNAQQIYVGAHQRGLLVDATKLEDLFGQTMFGQYDAMASAGKRFLQQPLKGVAHNAATAAAEYREHYIRLAHFTSAIDKAMKAGKTDLKQIMDDASREVRKWHPDGRDMTDFEQKIKMVMPFYSWVRKSTPLLVQSMVTAPAKNLAYPRGMVALQNMLGINSSMQDPFPNDQLFPDWIRAYDIGPIGDPTSPVGLARWFGNLGQNMVNYDGSKYGYTVINPSNPMLDFGAQFLGYNGMDTIKGIGSSLTPAIKIPGELYADKQFSGAPISQDAGGQGVVPYLMQQVPFITPFTRVTGTGKKPRPDVENQNQFDVSKLINMLTAGGVHGTGPYIKSAEFEAKNRAKQAQQRLQQ